MVLKGNAFEGLFGIEKENLRVTERGALSQRAHRAVFGEKNPYIIRDFAETQMEMITRPHRTIQGAYDELHNIQHVVMATLEDEYLWPQSNPPHLPQDDQIAVGDYKDSDKKAYREYLSAKYGNKRSVISGIHFNLSFSDAYLQQTFKDSTHTSFSAFKNQLYLKIIKYFLKDRWLFTKLFAASPVFHNSYMEKCVSHSIVNAAGDCTRPGMISMRNSACGYKNTEALALDYTSLQHYNQGVENLMKRCVIYDEREIYAPARLKKDSEGNVSYIELRFVDINPLFFNGVAQADLELMHMLFVYYASQADFEFTKSHQDTADVHNNFINTYTADTLESQATWHHLVSYATTLFEDLEAMMKRLDSVPYAYQTIIKQAYQRLTIPERSYANIIAKGIRKSDYLTYHMEIAKTQMRYVKDNPLVLQGYEGLELSTKILIQSAIKLGKLYTVLDAHENFIQLHDVQLQQTEYVKQATKTSLDCYSNVLLMENKALTKKVLAEHNIAVPGGYTVTSQNQALEIFHHKALPSQIVIKPNNTNFGEGITIFKDGFDQEAYTKAIDYALSYDKTVVLEPFVQGKEYRFLIIDGKVVGVLHRKAANVLGDGKHTIQELIAIKNQDPLRNKGYKTPLELIEVDAIVLAFIKQQGYTLDTVVAQGERVYLRENSNISTGGDSIDMTDAIHPSYFESALACVRALKVKITGVDMMIEAIDIPATKENHAVIEMNFNPAIHIHCYPYMGKHRNIGDLIIAALFKGE